MFCIVSIGFFCCSSARIFIKRGVSDDYSKTMQVRSTDNCLLLYLPTRIRNLEIIQKIGKEIVKEL